MTTRYFAIRHVDFPGLVRIAEAPDAIEALFMTFGRERRGGKWRSKDIDRCVRAKINQPDGWEVI